MSVEEAYHTLGLRYGAPEEDVKRAWKRLVLEWHPDKNGNSVESKERTQRLVSAKELLLAFMRDSSETMRKAREAANESQRKAAEDSQQKAAEESLRKTWEDRAAAMEQLRKQQVEQEAAMEAAPKTAGGAGATAAARG